MTQCEWCGSTSVQLNTNDVFWELPDGSRAIEINDTPCVECDECGIQYQNEETINKIENHLMLINLESIPSSLTYDELMRIKKHLKRNYFDF